MNHLAKVAFLARACALLVTTFSVIGPRTVQAESKTTLVRDEDNPARHPFQAACFASSEQYCTVATVPEGQRLLIQGGTVHAIINPGPGSAVWASISTIANGSPVFHNVGMQDLGPTVGAFETPHAYIAIVPFTLYADPGTEVRVFVRRGFVALESISLSASISGYTVSLP